MSWGQNPFFPHFEDPQCLLDAGEFTKSHRAVRKYVHARRIARKILAVDRSAVPEESEELFDEIVAEAGAIQRSSTMLKFFWKFLHRDMEATRSDESDHVLISDSHRRELFHRTLAVVDLYGDLCRASERLFMLLCDGPIRRDHRSCRGLEKGRETRKDGASKRKKGMRECYKNARAFVGCTHKEAMAEVRKQWSDSTTKEKKSQFYRDMEGVENEYQQP